MKTRRWIIAAAFICLVTACFIISRLTGFPGYSAFGWQGRVDTTDGSIPLYVQALAKAYPDQIVGYRNEAIVFRDGIRMTCDDKKDKDHVQRLDKTDIEDMFHDIYPVGEHEVPGYCHDPGRYRCKAFFKKVYGRNEKKVLKNLVTVNWFGQKILFSRINHAADSLRAVERELKSLCPQYEEYFRQSSSFDWRKVRGADRMSAHSYGVALDICVDFSDYWSWSNHGINETDSLTYQNRIPAEIVDVFERHGFISGTKWYHYDTMHFEFRPELLIYNELNHYLLAQ